MFNFALLWRRPLVSAMLGATLFAAAQTPAGAQPSGASDGESYRQKLETLEKLEAQTRYLEAQLADQARAREAQKASEANLATLDDGLVPHLFRLVDDLDAFVKGDVPFLFEERQARVASLRDVLSRADISLPEKYRLALEAYSIEAGFGHEVATYAGWLEAGGTRREVDFLRVGRLVLAYQTRDGAETGIWNAQASPPAWQTVNSRYAVEVARGLRIALKQAAPDWLTLPVAAPGP
ncbi:MAG: DUF3450 domain-containing protein [Pseudomonadota bacterium]